MAQTKHYGDGESTHFSTQYTPTQDFVATVGGVSAVISSSTPAGITLAVTPAVDAEILITHTAESYLLSYQEMGLSSDPADGLPFALNVTGAQLRDALADPTSWGLQPHNYIRNGASVGAVAGTPGTVPTNWTTDSAGLTSTITTGVTLNGLPAIDVRFQGTATGNAYIVFESQTAGTIGQTFTNSVFVALQAGSIANTTPRIVVEEYAVAAYVIEQSAPFTPIPAGSRPTLTRTLTGTSTTRITSMMTLGTVNTAVVDITLRIACPQLNLGAVALHPVLTTGTASTQTHGWLLPGLGGARLSGDCRTSVAMQTLADGSVGYAAHNLLTYSADFGNEAWIKTGATVTANAATAPDGNLAADFVLPGVGSSPQRLLQNPSAASAIYTLSVYVRAAGYNKVAIKESATTGVHAAFDLSTASVIDSSAGVTASITALANSWFRIGLAMSVVSAGGLQLSVLAPAYVSGDPNGSSFSGDGTSGVYLWGAQLNLGPTALPYVPTGAAARFGPAIDWLSGIGQYGIRSEAARTNLVLYSADMSNAAWGVNTPTKGAAAAGLDGTLSALPLTFASATDSQMFQFLTASSAPHVFSVYARSAAAKKFRLKIYTGATDVISADLVTTANWQRFAYAGTFAVSNFGVINEAAGGAGTVEFWCPQLELGTEASSPILTYAAAATRAADTLVVLDSGWINQTEGTLAADYVPSSPITDVGGVYSLNDATENNRVDYRAGQGVSIVTTSSVNVAVLGVSVATAGALNRTATAYSADNFAASQNGAAVVTDTSGATPVTTRLNVGRLATDYQLNGHLTRIRYSRRRLSNTQLRNLSA